MPVYVVAANPGIFTGLAGQEQVAAVNQDQTLNSPANPAGRGSVVTFFATGVGATLPALEDGQQPQPPVFPTPVLPLSVVIGGQGVPAQDVLFAGLVYAGVLQVNVRIPESAPAGAAAPLLVRIECEKGRWCESQPGATLALR
jgi:uncharacterized protein (TIGR03437 family)